MAITIPGIPAKRAPIKIIKKISNGWAFTELEKIIGCNKKSSIERTIPKTIVNWSKIVPIFKSPFNEVDRNE